MTESLRHGHVDRAEKDAPHMQRGEAPPQCRATAHPETLFRNAHELRGRLAFIRLALEGAVAGRVLRLQRRTQLLAAVDEADALIAGLFGDLRGSESPPSAHCGVRPLVAAAMKPSAYVAERCGIHLVNRVSPRLSARTDHDAAGRILRILIANALDAITSMGRGGTVEVTAKQLKRHVLLAVSDDGPGLCGDVRERLFVAFNAGPSSRGLGLGLSTAHALAGCTGVELSLRETRPGRTVFELLLHR